MGASVNSMNFGYLFLSVKPHTLPRCPLQPAQAVSSTLARPGTMASAQNAWLGPSQASCRQGGHLLGWQGSGLPVALRGAPHPQECGAWQPPGRSGHVCLEVPLRQPQRCSKRPGLRRLRRRQKDKSNPFLSLIQAGFSFQEL